MYLKIVLVGSPTPLREKTLRNREDSVKKLLGEREPQGKPSNSQGLLTCLRKRVGRLTAGVGSTWGRGYANWDQHRIASIGDKLRLPPESPFTTPLWAAPRVTSK